MSERVCAVVVTYNRKEMLRECLQNLLEQTRRPDRILAVDNASTDGTVRMLRAEFPEVEVLALSENAGGSGGFHDGMRDAHAAGFDWIWVMDDDANAAPDCLEKLLAASEPSRVMVPLQQDAMERLYGVWTWDGNGAEVAPEIVRGMRPKTAKYLFAFVGALIPSSLIARGGLPNRDFFIWFDDWEYALRLQALGPDVMATVVPDAILFHNVASKPRHARFLWRRSIRIVPAPWKLYYGTRNPLFFLLRSRRPRRELFRYLLFQQRWILGDLLYGPERFARIRMRLHGLWDGAFGRLGKRVVPG